MTILRGSGGRPFFRCVRTADLLAVVLEEGVLKHLQLVMFCISNYEDAFRKALGAKRDAEARKELSGKRRTLQKSKNRIAELDRLFKRIYEDMVAERLSEARFQMLSGDYEKEQTELTPAILNDLAKAVYVHAPDKSSRHRVQDVDISCNYIGILPVSLLNDLINGSAA